MQPTSSSTAGSRPSDTDEATTKNAGQHPSKQTNGVHQQMLAHFDSVSSVRTTNAGSKDLSSAPDSQQRGHFVNTKPGHPPLLGGKSDRNPGGPLLWQNDKASQTQHQSSVHPCNASVTQSLSVTMAAPTCSPRNSSHGAPVSFPSTSAGSSTDSFRPDGRVPAFPISSGLSRGHWSAAHQAYQASASAWGNVQGLVLQALAPGLAGGTGALPAARQMYFPHPFQSQNQSGTST